MLRKHRQISIFLFLLFAINHVAIAAPPIMEIITVADPDVEFFFKKGQFLVLNKKADIAMYPLISILPTDIPYDVSSWQKIEQTCQPLADNSSSELNVSIKRHQYGYRIQVLRDGQLRAETTWLSSANICHTMLQDVDNIKGPELLVLHQQHETLFGITIFRLPESSNY